MDYASEEKIAKLAVYIALSLFALTIFTAARDVIPAQAKSQPAQYVALRAFVEYKELGAYDVFIVTAQGERLELNELCARDNLKLVTMTEDTQGYKVAIFTTP